jgi:hypothetical protein
MHSLDAWQSSQGLAAIVASIRRAPIEPGMPVPPILIVALPKIQKAKGKIVSTFQRPKPKQGVWLQQEILRHSNLAVIFSMPGRLRPPAESMAFTSMKISIWLLGRPRRPKQGPYYQKKQVWLFLD